MGKDSSVIRSLSVEFVRRPLRFFVCSTGLAVKQKVENGVQFVVGMQLSTNIHRAGHRILIGTATSAPNVPKYIRIGELCHLRHPGGLVHCTRALKISFHQHQYQCDRPANTPYLLCLSHPSHVFNVRTKPHQHHSHPTTTPGHPTSAACSLNSIVNLPPNAPYQNVVLRNTFEDML